MDIATIARFWSKVNKFGPVHPVLGTRCWVWLAGKMPSGYGKFTMEGKQYSAHRVSWLITHGCWPEPLGLHKCDNRACVRINHLFEGDTDSNVADRVEKKRSAVGSRHGLSKLTESKVLEIRSRYAAGNTSYKKLAKAYRVSSIQILYVVRRITWRHI